MATPGKFKALEQREGRPLTEILLEGLNRYGSIAQLSRHLDIGYDNCYRKVQELGLYQKPGEWVAPESDRAE